MGSTGTTSSASGSLTVHERWYFSNDTWTHPGPATPVEILAIAPGGGGTGGSVPGSPGGAGSDGGNVTVTTDPGGTLLLTALGGGKGVAAVAAVAKPTQNTQGFSLGKKAIRTGGGVLTVDLMKGTEGGVGFMAIGSGGAAGDNFTAPAGADDMAFGYGGNSGEVKTYYGPVSEDLDIVIGSPGTGGTPGSTGSGQAGEGQKGQPGAVRIRWLE